MRARIARRAAALCVALLLGAAAPEPGPYDDKATVEGWVWARVKAGETADLNLRCDPTGKIKLDPSTDSEAQWGKACRRLDPAFVEDILANPKWKDAIHRHGIRLIGARIDGSIDLDNAEIAPEVWLDRSWIAGDLLVGRARFNRVLSMDGTRLSGSLSGNRMVVGQTLFMRNARLEKPVSLTGAHVDGHVELGGARFEQLFDADSLEVGQNLVMGRDTSFGGNVRLIGASVGGQLSADASTFQGVLDADSLHVRGSMFLTEGAHAYQRVELRNARIDGQLLMNQSIFDGAVNLSGARIGQELYIEDDAPFTGGLRLISTKVGGQMSLAGSTFEGSITGDSLQVSEDLFLNRAARFDGSLELAGAKVDGLLTMTGATFVGVVDVSGLRVGKDWLIQGRADFRDQFWLPGATVGGDLVMAGAAFADALHGSGIQVGRSLNIHAVLQGPLDLSFAHVGGGVDLRDSDARDIDLTGAVITQDLKLGGGNMDDIRWHCESGEQPIPAAGAAAATTWRTAHCARRDRGLMPRLLLRNVDAGALQDSPDAWPPELDLEGFRYTRLGSLGSDRSNDMRQRSAQWWGQWLDRDRTFSTQPYTQLAGLLMTTGHREEAEAIQYLAREHERAQSLAQARQRAWDAAAWGGWAWLTILWGLAGYGIGNYTFVVINWVIVFTLLGAVVLQFAPNARAKGPVWCVGASLHRLLPVVELNKDFQDFFENPAPADPAQRRNLNGFLVFFFSVLALLGWVLGFFLLAAMGGLTQKGG